MSGIGAPPSVSSAPPCPTPFWALRDGLVTQANASAVKELESTVERLHQELADAHEAVEDGSLAGYGGLTDPSGAATS
eukprot:COSAG01_NODE_3593_length_5898_cov_5.089310_2_plen_78_part_00